MRLSLRRSSAMQSNGPPARPVARAPARQQLGGHAPESLQDERLQNLVHLHRVAASNITSTCRRSALVGGSRAESAFANRRNPAPRCPWDRSAGAFPFLLASSRGIVTETHRRLRVAEGRSFPHAAVTGRRPAASGRRRPAARRRPPPLR